MPSGRKISAAMKSGKDWPDRRAMSLAQQHVSHVAVFEFIPRREIAAWLVFLVHRQQVVDRQDERGVPQLFGKLDVVRDAGGVVQQMPDGDAFVVRELGDMLRQRIVKAEPAAAGEQHDAESGERLRH